ncbi:hypothetical protein [Pseudomonas syringae]|uniref:hypothetical protein n=1 Tax=Pseudomonas syringae TaxID=317 RepID=UPI00128FC91F|nr:hypothetical protein [Pseudomonas syringae]
MRDNYWWSGSPKPTCLFYVLTLFQLVLIALVLVSFWLLSIAIMAGVLLIMGWFGLLAEISESEVVPGADYLGADLCLGE